MSQVSWLKVMGVCLCGLFMTACVQGAEDDAATLDAIYAAADANTEAFNAGKVDDVVAGFLPQGEWIDENGNVYQGREEIADVLKRYFAAFPDARIMLSVESVRLLGPIAIDEGIRVMTCGKSPSPAHIRYIATRVKTDDGWKIASLRDFQDDLPITPRERLEPLSWLVGEWINEGTDGEVRISYEWSENGNFLLGNYIISQDNNEILRTSQRIGWDPVAGKVRSWLFDSDGGYGGGQWTETPDGWVIKSEAVSPDGVVGSATVTLTQQGSDRFRLKGTDRIIGTQREEDFEVEVVRRPPASGK